MNAAISPPKLPDELGSCTQGAPCRGGAVSGVPHQPQKEVSKDSIVGD